MPCSCGSRMLSPTESTPASRAPRLAASMIPGPPPVITASPASPSARADLPGALVLGVVGRRARRAEDADRRAEPGRASRSRCAARARSARRRSASVRVEIDVALLGADDLLAEAGRSSGCVSGSRPGSRLPSRVHMEASERPQLPLRRARRRRLRPRARRPARDRAADGRRRPRGASVRDRAAAGRPAARDRAQGDRDRHPGARQRGDRGERRLRAPRARAPGSASSTSGSAETLEEGAEALAERIARAFGAERNDSVQAQIKEIVSAETRQHREALLQHAHRRGRRPTR